MDNSLLAGLPPELRGLIYEFVLIEQSTIEINFRKACREIKGLARKPLALTSTCKQIHAESLPVFYGKNHFKLIVGRFHCPSPYDKKGDNFVHRLSLWLTKIGFENERSLRSVQIAMCLRATAPWTEIPKTLASSLAPIARFLLRSGKHHSCSLTP